MKRAQPLSPGQWVALAGVEEVDVKMVVDPPWTPARMTIGVVSPGANSVWRATYASRLSTPGG